MEIWTVDREGDHGADITEAVQVLYDMATSSMDWGSGMLSNEEVETVIKLAILLGFQMPSLDYYNNAPMAEVARRYPEHYVVSEEPDPYNGRYSGQAHRTLTHIRRVGEKYYCQNTKTWKIAGQPDSTEEL